MLLQEGCVNFKLLNCVSCASRSSHHFKNTCSQIYIAYNLARAHEQTRDLISCRTPITKTCFGIIFSSLKPALVNPHMALPSLNSLSSLMYENFENLSQQQDESFFLSRKTLQKTVPSKSFFSNTAVFSEPNLWKKKIRKRKNS